MKKNLDYHEKEIRLPWRNYSKVAPAIGHMVVSYFREWGEGGRKWVFKWVFETLKYKGNVLYFNDVCAKKWVFEGKWWKSVRIFFFCNLFWGNSVKNSQKWRYVADIYITISLKHTFKNSLKNSPETHILKIIVEKLRTFYMCKVYFSQEQKNYIFTLNTADVSWRKPAGYVTSRASAVCFHFSLPL